MRGVEKLSAARVAKAVKAGQRGRLGDGGGLFLQVTTTGAASWVFRFTEGGRERWLGLGPLHAVSLADARAKARMFRGQRVDGIDPIAEAAKRKAARASMVTFAVAADRFADAYGAGWRNAKHRAQWRSSLKAYADPIIGRLPVGGIETADVMRVIEPLWAAKTQTGDRLRNRIERVLDWAGAQGLREGPNPARWRGHLDHLLPASRKVAPIRHHAAMPYAELPSFMAKLREQDGTAARALEFLILTAARSGEVLGAQWEEIDLAERTWTIPGSRMKAGKEHRVALSARAVEVITGIEGPRTGAIFRRPRGDTLGVLAMDRTAKLLAPGITIHGFRSSFRDWAAERTNFPREICETALAHNVGNSVENAYRRSDLIEKRRALMDTWATFCTKPAPAGEVVPIAGRVAS
jgi:integrase